MSSNVLALILTIALAAEEPTAVLEVVRGPGAEACPTQRDFENAVTARLGRAPFTPSAPLQLKVSLTLESGVLFGRIVATDGKGVPRTREVSSKTRDCSELAKAIELALTLSIDPRRGLITPTPTPTPTPAPSPTQTTPPAPTPTPAPPSPPIQATFGLGLLGTVGTSPLPTGGASASIGLRRGWMQLELLGRAELPRSLSVEGGTVTAFTLLGELAFGARGQYWAVGLLASGGALRVEGSGFFSNNRVTVPLALLGARAMALWPVHPSWTLGLELRGQAHLIRTTVNVGATQVWQTPAIAGAVGLIVMWNSP